MKKKHGKTPIPWGTQAEINFLKTIADNEKALRGYIQGCKKRENWGSIDKKAVIVKAKELLRACAG